ncbi:glycoside hydrolase family 3 C-terminal domain-containing protein [Cellulomonas sp. 179-A 9B4 NHS]|uniref:glycoside hydrolase family 3 C-terminal domain-containing protein n=1 Tax=Cellulomonas sp. 179-A 9B4 NHS TaxID=3142379 RepID=UPI0039A3F71F
MADDVRTADRTDDPTATGAADHAWRDADRPVAERARALLAALTREEKVALLHQHAPAVDRVGLAAFRTGAEVLHGVAWLGRATCFPQPVGLAATWDADLVERVGAVVGTELRAKHAADPTVSLNVWAPVVNPLRHPAWGRNEEGFSSDPHVTAWLAGAYARGLRGDHPVYWRTVPTLKHFLAYNNETDRAVTSSGLPPRVLREHELPAFRGPVEAGVVGAVMPSYNLVNGRPNHVARELLDELRSWTDLPLLVVSDAAAPGNLVTFERYFDDHVASHAAMVRAGVDSFTDNDADARPTVQRVTAALDAGLLDEADVDRAVLRQLELRIRTGELDPDRDPWVVGPDAIDLPAHRALARESVARSVVVLENDGVLPLVPGARVAVVGPHADRVLHDWYSGTPPYLTGLGTALADRLGADRVAVADGADRVVLTSATTGGDVRPLPDGTLVADGDGGDGTLVDVVDWGHGLLTLRGVEADRLWSGAGWVLRADATRVGGWVAQESFRAHRHDDGTWSLQHVGSGRWVRVQHDEAGTLVAEAQGPGTAERFAVRVVRSGASEVARVAADADVVVVTAGNDPHLHGRETEDRPDLDLPAAQRALWRAAAGANPRTVLLVVSSYPYVLPPETDAASAVVWTSHGGQELGPGLTDVLVGDVEPTGRLAQWWPADAAQAGDLLEYDVVGARTTDWWSPAPPRYGLGHGLTYGAVRYVAAAASPAAHDVTGLDPARGPGGAPAVGEPAVEVRVTVANDGPRTAHELVQVHVEAPEHRLAFPRRLLAHARVALRPGASADVVLRVPVRELATWDVTRDRWVVEPGTYVLGVGPSATTLPLRTSVEVTGPAVPPRVLVGRAVRAADADARTGLVLTDRTRDAGDAVQVPRGRGRGHVVLRTCATAGATTVAAEVARTRPGAASVTVRDEVTGRLLARVDVPEGGGRYDWATVTAPFAAPSADVVDLRVELDGPARLAAVRLD